MFYSKTSNANLETGKRNRRENFEVNLDLLVCLYEGNGIDVVEAFTFNVT